MATLKTMTLEEKRKHQVNVINQWKKDMAEAQRNLEERCKTPEFKQVLKELKEANAKKGIIIPGEI